MPKRYHKMTRNERIEHSDKIALLRLEEELLQKRKHEKGSDKDKDC